jgi:CRISPR-associated Cas5-like protein
LKTVNEKSTITVATCAECEMNNNTIAFEIAGPAAMFARPDTGSTPTSYPVPTFSAAIGMFEM